MAFGAFRAGSKAGDAEVEVDTLGMAAMDSHLDIDREHKRIRLEIGQSNYGGRDIA